MNAIRHGSVIAPVILVLAATLLGAGCGSPEPGMNGDAAMSDTSDGMTAQAGEMTEGTTAAAGEMMEPGNVLASGRFVDKGGQHTSGGYRIESTDGGLQLILEEDFRTDEGPDLHLVLATVSTEEVESENATADEATIIVAPLEKLEGPQRHELPDGMDLSVYKSVLIHCVEFTHLYGAAPLSVR